MNIASEDQKFEIRREVNEINSSNQFIYLRVLICHYFNFKCSKEGNESFEFIIFYVAKYKSMHGQNESGAMLLRSWDFS